MDRFGHFIRSLVPALGLAVFCLAAIAFAQTPPQTLQHASPAPVAAPKTPAAAKPRAHLTPKQLADGVLGKRVYGAGGEDMGLVTDVLVNHAGEPIAAVIDFGGFLGLGSRKIAIDWRLLRFHPGNDKRPITLSLHKAQLQAAPAYEPGKPAKILGAPIVSPAVRTEQSPDHHGQK
jgi:PRC-barrel domain